MNGTFSGIGSREIPHSIAMLIFQLGFALTLRKMKTLTGGAPGSDDAFEKGARSAHKLLTEFTKNPGSLDQYLTVFLPWEGFNYRLTSDTINTIGILPEAFSIASKFHPAWKSLGEGSFVRPLMARNSHQVLDRYLNQPVRFVFCYTSDGVTSGEMTTNKTGGTGQAIRLASSESIPVYNVGNPEHNLRAKNFIEHVFTEFGHKLGVNIYEYSKHEFRNYMPFSRREEIDLVDAALGGNVEGIIHDCNCWNTPGSNLSRRINEVFPEASQADRLTKKGDKAKLGTFSYAKALRNGREITIINAYTQYKYGTKDELYCDYKKLKNVCISIRKAFPNMILGVPRIGSGKANGSWLTTSDIVANELGKTKTILYDFEKDSLEETKEPEQTAFDI